jgi:hypothetical protein
MVEKEKCGPSAESERRQSRSGTGIRLGTGPREIGVDLSGSSRSPISLSRPHSQSPSPSCCFDTPSLGDPITQWRRMIAKHIFGRWTHHLRSVFYLRSKTRLAVNRCWSQGLGGVGKLPGRHDRTWLRICPGPPASDL